MPLMQLRFVCLQTSFIKVRTQCGMPHDGLAADAIPAQFAQNRAEQCACTELSWECTRLYLACCFLYGLVSCWFIYLLKTDFCVFFSSSFISFVASSVRSFRRVFLIFFHLFILWLLDSLLSVFFPLRCAFVSLCASFLYSSLLVRNFVSSSYLPTTLKAH